RPFYRKKRFMIPSCVLLTLLIAAVVIGVIMGTKSKPTKYVCVNPFEPADAIDTGNFPSSSVLGHFDNDTYIDIAIANSNDDTVSVLLGDKAQIFRSTRPAIGESPSSMIAVDLNNDNKIDLVVANTDDDTVSVLFGLGNGLFLDAVDYDVGQGPNYLTFADFNNDSQLDIAVTNRDDVT
ncbi:unnamed protein product, partial [Adineta steineri]